MVEINKDDRHSISFEEAEGVKDLPQPLKLKELSPQLRNQLWSMMYLDMEEDSRVADFGGSRYLGDKWGNILKLFHVFHWNFPIDEFSHKFDGWAKSLKDICLKCDYVSVLGAFQYIIRQHKPNDKFVKSVEFILKRNQAAYILLDGKSFYPVASEQEHLAVKRALINLANSEYRGARAYLVKAGENYNSGDNAGAVREAIHAVEAIARSMEPKANTLGPALYKLEKNGKIHTVLKSAFNSLYNYTSDEEGVRHALIEKDSPSVDSAEALFMIGACASFVTYLISKGDLAALSD